MELTREEKKICRNIIARALQRDYEKAILKTENIIQKWKNKEADSAETFFTLYNTLKERDKYIAMRYDNISASSYLQTLAILLIEETLTMDDLNELTHENRKKVNYIARLFSNMG